MLCFFNQFKSYNCLLNKKKSAIKKFGLRIWFTKKLFGYQIMHHSYKLMSFPEHMKKIEKTLLLNFEV